MTGPRAACQPRAFAASLLAMARRRSFLAELFDFILAHKAWLLAPIILVLVLAGLLIILGGTKAAPFIYTLF